MITMFQNYNLDVYFLAGRKKKKCIFLLKDKNSCFSIIYYNLHYLITEKHEFLKKR